MWKTNKNRLGYLQYFDINELTFNIKAILSFSYVITVLSNRFPLVRDSFLLLNSRNIPNKQFLFRDGRHGNI